MVQSPSFTTREAGTSKPARRTLKRRPAASHFLVGLAIVMAFGLNVLALQGRGDSSLVAVADTAISAGAKFSPELVRMVPVPADFAGIGSLVHELDLAGFSGWIVQREIPAGGVIDRSNLAQPAGPGGLRAMSVPVPIARAAGGMMVVGDRVDVVAVRDGVARYVVTGVEVLSVAQLGTGFASIDFHLVLAVDAAQTLALAEAIATGPIDIVRSTGAEAVEGSDGS